MSDVLSFKDALCRPLAQDDLDFDEIQRLSSALLHSDPDRVRFFVDSRIVNKLGEELVSKKETALAELIKNSFDADATHVHVAYSDREVKGGQLLIEDDGEG